MTGFTELYVYHIYKEVWRRKLMQPLYYDNPFAVATVPKGHLQIVLFFSYACHWTVLYSNRFKDIPEMC